MTDRHQSQTIPAESMVYQIRLQGHLPCEWSSWFEDLEITWENGDTLLTGPIVDQAALHGLLKRIRDLGTPLISVIRVNAGHFSETEI